MDKEAMTLEIYKQVVAANHPTGEKVVHTSFPRSWIWPSARRSISRRTMRAGWRPWKPSRRTGLCDGLKLKARQKAGRGV